MSKSQGFSPPSAFIDLTMILLGLFVLNFAVSVKQMQQEYQTTVNLLSKRTQQQEIGIGPDMISLSIIKKGIAGYRFVLESKKLGVKEFQGMSDLTQELKRLAPKELVMRVGQNVEFGVPQEIMIFADENNIILGISYQRKETALIMREEINVRNWLVVLHEYLPGLKPWANDFVFA